MMILLESTHSNNQSAQISFAPLVCAQDYPEIYNPKYDFLGQSYASIYPNLHKYPATMLPQIGLELFRDFKAEKSMLLDPYCGSGSSFISGIEYGIKEFIGFDLNPLALMITKAKLTFIDSQMLLEEKGKILNQVLAQRFKEQEMVGCKLNKNPLDNITNLDFWIEKNAQDDLKIIFSCIKSISNIAIQNLLMLAFSETLRESSYTRNNEFKLFRMKNHEQYKPNVVDIFSKNLESLVNDYLTFYQPKIQNIGFNITNSSFRAGKHSFDTILTSPPYGDSRTTVAYGQFSTFINEWLGYGEARKLDSKLMGGSKATNFYNKGFIKDYIFEIAKVDKKRALEVSSFYFDLETSIKSMLDSINRKGKVFFIIGNRKVKNIILPTDRFIAEVFCNHGFKHLQTIKRKISNKSMPLQNSPSNRSGAISSTMNEEYIVVCEKYGVH